MNNELSLKEILMLTASDGCARDEQSPVQPIVRWIVSEVHNEVPTQWQLMVSLPGRETTPAATVWLLCNGDAAWHTWDREGIGGENSVVRNGWSSGNVIAAKEQATLAAVQQGFI
jgi:hypothetical protein